MRHGFDFMCALAGLLLLSPLLTVMWLAVVLETGRPGFFRQERVGRGTRPFTLYKFRSMTVHQGTEKGSFDAGSGARVTRIGRFLRKTKLDELPQLWNVLKGDMSLVGPRPEISKWVDAYPERWASVLTVRPGITDPASIEFRNEEELLAKASDPEHYYRTVILPRKLDLYEKYVSNQTFWGDISILMKTLWAVLARQG